MNFANWISSLPGVTALGMIWGIMAIGVFITYKILDIADLTVDGSICTGAAVCTMLVVSGVNIWLAILAAVAAGMLCGLITGLAHTLLGIPAILAGILTQLMLWSINLVIMGKANVALLGKQDVLLISNLSERILKTNLILLAFVIVVIALLYWFFGTELGASLRATGSNLNMSRAQGINTNFTKVLGLMISNGLVALSGALLAQNNGAADINMGRGAIVIGLAAVIIGEVLGEAIFRKRMNFVVKMLFVIVGGILYYIAMGIVLWLKMPTDDTKLFTAIIVAIFLAVPYLQKKSKTSFKKVAKMNLKANKANGGSDNA